jgi:excisionase family DNA binding protein
VENVSAPPEVEEAIDKRSSMSVIGNLNDYVKYQMGQGMAKGGGGGAAGTAAELAAGFGIAQQMMQQGAFSATAAPGRAHAPDLMGLAEAAQYLGVSEADVMASITAGDLKAKKIGSQYRILKTAIDEFLAQ